MSYSQHYADKSPSEVVEHQRARARARYEAKRQQPGGEGVEMSPARPDTDSSTLGQKIPPNKDPAPASVQEQEHAIAQVPTLAQEQAARDAVRTEPITDCDIEQDQVSALDRIHDLVAAMAGFVTTHSLEATEAWKELERDYGPIKPEEAPLVVPIIGLDDPPSVQKAKVIRKLPGNKWMVRPFKLSKAPEGVLFLRGQEWVRESWTVFVIPNPFESQGGYRLHGEYNRYGDRLK